MGNRKPNLYWMSAFDRLGAERSIAALHSWGDTMSDLEVLQMLKEQNDIMLANAQLSA